MRKDMSRKDEKIKMHGRQRLYMKKLPEMKNVFFLKIENKALNA